MHEKAAEAEAEKPPKKKKKKSKKEKGTGRTPVLSSLAKGTFDVGTMVHQFLTYF